MCNGSFDNLAGVGTDCVRGKQHFVSKLATKAAVGAVRAAMDVMARSGIDMSQLCIPLANSRHKWWSQLETLKVGKTQI